MNIRSHRPVPGRAPRTRKADHDLIRIGCVATAAAVLTPCAFAQSASGQATQLQPVVVVGKTDPARGEAVAEQSLTPGGVTLVEGEELRQRNVTSLTDMLRYVPGVWAASGTTGDSSFLSSRGSNLDATNYDNNGIKLLQDGLPVTAADGSNHNRDVDPLTARYIIVARGANALTYGASTLGGAIDFISPTARDGAPNEVLVNAGSHRQRQGRVTFGNVSGNFDGLVTLEGKRSDGYREHQRQERAGLYANAGWQLGDAVTTRFYANAIDNDQQLPGVLSRDQWRADPRQAEAAAVAGNYRLNVKSWRLANKTTWKIGPDSSLTAGLSYEEQQLYHPIVFAPPYFSLLIDTRLRNIGTTLRYQHRVGSHDLLAGLNYGRTSVKGGNFGYVPDDDRTLTTRVDNHADSLELFVMDRWRVAPSWTVVFGAQAVSANREVRNVTVADGSERNPKGDYDRINPRVGVIHQLTPNVQLFANLSRLYEPPTLYELEDDVRGDGSTLNAMHGSVVEVGTRGRQNVGRNLWHWDVALYYARLRDEILSRDDPNAPGTSLSTNVGRTIHAGLEALVGASLALDSAGAHRIEPLVSLTLNRFRFKNDAVYGDNRLPAAPRYAIRGEALYRHSSGFFAGPTFDFIGRRMADFSNTYKVDAYHLWGLRAGLGAEKWEIYAEARNLADKHYVSFFSVRDVAAADAAILNPGAPRSVYVGARLRY
ncbi:TonB-dependent receptor family protein [Piscinibacter koreensis]|uniref:TonB-dependent receptor n=1 Tax=Piscinibacter koreensis TaxID=2742824 RepID=A0A7Y6NPD8_9BURK|nr:TonB-dependent receptor [Schlegelella koreensis]NUZ06802.1 TonB-dependent receptor [Schlegelella koreensis]